VNFRRKTSTRQIYCADFIVNGLVSEAERNSAMNLTTRAFFSIARKEPFNTLSSIFRRKGWVNKAPFPGNDWMFQ
jgi:hypothetical protein